jgi:hypothetical protein
MNTVSFTQAITNGRKVHHYKREYAMDFTTCSIPTIINTTVWWVKAVFYDIENTYPSTIRTIGYL